jgi:hypothetical protein
VLVAPWANLSLEKENGIMTADVIATTLSKASPQQLVNARKVLSAQQGRHGYLLIQTTITDALEAFKHQRYDDHNIAFLLKHKDLGKVLNGHWPVL